MVQNLLQHQKNLLVEGMSDFYYLQALSVQCARTSRQTLPDEIHITPCGGTKNVGLIAIAIPRAKRKTSSHSGHGPSWPRQEEQSPERALCRA